MEKQEEKMVTIPESEYRELKEISLYLHDWDSRFPSRVKCPKCGHYHPSGYICLYCDRR